MATLKEQFIQSLTWLGEVEVKKTFAYVVFSRKEGGHYYVGRSGGLRFGKTIASSIPCSEKFKKQLLDMVGPPIAQ